MKEGAQNMKYGEFKKVYNGGHKLRAAEDIPGFVRKGHALYGNCDDMIVVDWLYQPLNGIYTVFLKNEVKREEAAS